AFAATSTSSTRPSSSRPKIASAWRVARTRERARLAPPAPTSGAEAVEVERSVVHREVVTPADSRQPRRVADPGRDVNRPTALVLSIACVLCPPVPRAREPARHPVFDLLLERPVDGGASNRRVRLPDPLVELLGGKGPLRRRQCLRHHDPLSGASPASRRETRVDG